MTNMAARFGAPAFLFCFAVYIYLVHFGLAREVNVLVQYSNSLILL